MSDGQQENIELNNRYFWPKPDLSTFAYTITGTITNFVGSDAWFRASVEVLGPPKIRKRFKTTSELTAALSHPLDNIDVHLASNTNNRTVRMYINLKSKYSVDVNISVPDYDVEEARALMHSIEKEMELQQEVEEQYLDRLIESNNSYQIHKPSTVEWFTKLAALLEPYGKSSKFFSGDFRVYNSDFRYSKKSFQEWRASIIDMWDKVRIVGGSISTDRLSINVNLDFEDDELRLRIESVTQAENEDLVALFQQQLNLETKRDSKDRDKLHGFRRSYFTKVRVNQSWFDVAASYIKTYFRKNPFFGGEFRVISAPQQSVTFRDFDIWKNSIANRWDEIIDIRSWMTGDTLHLSLNCDPRREIVELAVEAVSIDQVNHLFLEFEQKLQLELIEEQPYKEPRSSGYFRIPAFRGKTFVSALSDAIRLFFEREPVVTEAQVVQVHEETNAIQTFDNLQSFLERLQDPKEYSEVHLVVQGIHGSALGVHVVNELSKLELKSTLGSDEFPQLVRIFKKPLRLEDIEVNSSTEESKGKNISDSLWVKAGLPILTLVLGFVLSPAFLGAMFPKETLQVTVPRTDTLNIRAQTNSQEIPIEWVIEREQWFHKNINRNGSATVRVLKDGLIVVQELTGQQPGMKVIVEPGTYDIEVVSAVSGSSDKVKVIVSPNS